MDNNINLSVSEEVISTIVEKTVMSVPGVYDIPGGIIDGITNILGSKKTRGIKVEINDKTITLDVYVIVESSYLILCGLPVSSKSTNALCFLSIFVLTFSAS